ncbi:MAG: hypothetical protein NVS2B12_02500 [Ktedonobacteraceae bacterium]
MSDVWRIFVVEGDESLNQSLVNSLRKDGYVVQGVTSGVEAVRALWSEEYDVVLYGLKTPGADGFELLQWLRVYRPNTHTIIVGEAGSAAARTRALEGGAVSYLEEPLDFRVLKEELRRLLQQTGFSASLDSFDLLDVIQIITMSRKSITLLVNTGLEERGVLRFQNGELVWAEYGILRGEEAFFALAAHKNGTVVQQPWDEKVVSNVTQPLSRLIFQALQYRTKYANSQQYSGELEQVQVTSFSPANTMAEIDDTPFGFIPAAQVPQQAFSTQDTVDTQDNVGGVAREMGKSNAQKEWWELTDRLASTNRHVSGPDNGFSPDADGARNENTLDALMKSAETNTPSHGHAPIARQRTDLPSWLTDQPTASNLAAIKPTTRASANNASAVPATPAIKTPIEEWRLARDRDATTDHLQPKQPTSPQKKVLARETETLQPSSPTLSSSAPPPSLPRQENRVVVRNNTSGPLTPPAVQREDNSMLSSGVIRAQQAARRNYAALVSALQTLGYTIAGFVAAAVVTIDGQPIAQVAIDDMDISKMCKYFSTIQKSVLLAFDQEGWGGYEDTVITSAGRYVIMRIVGVEKRAFLVLMTVREANPAESLTAINDIENTIDQALRA